MGKYSYDFEINRFLLSECKGLTTKEKSTKLDDIEIKFFCSSKSIIESEKANFRVEKVFTIHISEKRFEPRIKTKTKTKYSLRKLLKKWRETR